MTAALGSVDPARVQALIDEGAVLVDIREHAEFARERIPGALNLTPDRLGDLPPAGAVIFHCRSGMRTGAMASSLRNALGADQIGYVLGGGIEAWRKSGGATEKIAGQPIEMMRQVQIVAGGLVLLGTLLGWLVAPPFFGIAAFVGAGLVFAGASGWCGMAKLLVFLPWNRCAPAA